MEVQKIRQSLVVHWKYSQGFVDGVNVRHEKKKKNRGAKEDIKVFGLTNKEEKNAIYQDGKDRGRVNLEGGKSVNE